MQDSVQREFEDLLIHIVFTFPTQSRIPRKRKGQRRTFIQKKRYLVTENIGNDYLNVSRHSIPITVFQFCSNKVTQQNHF